MKEESFHPEIGPWLRVAGLAAGVVIVVLLLVMVSRQLWSYTISNYLTGKLENDLLLDRNLAKAIASVIWIPFGYFLAQSFSLFGRKQRTIGAIGLSSYAAAFAFGSYLVQKGIYFTDEGAPAKYVALTSEGCRFSDEDGVDPRSGVDRRPVTQAILAACRGRDGFTSLDSIPMVFDVDTGEPLVWYAKDGGNTRFFLSPGFDSRSGLERERLTREALARIESESRRQAEEANRIRNDEANRIKNIGDQEDQDRDAREVSADFDQQLGLHLETAPHLPDGVRRLSVSGEIHYDIPCTQGCSREMKWEALRTFGHGLRRCQSTAAVLVGTDGWPIAANTIVSSGAQGCDRANEAWMAQTRWPAQNNPYWLAWDSTIILP